MNKLIFALLAGLIVLSPSMAQGDSSSNGKKAIMDNVIVSATADSWNVYGGDRAVREDPSVQGGKAMRVSIQQREKPWQTAASIPIKPSISRGDVILCAFWARAETPPAGSTNAYISSAGVGLASPPYTSFISEPLSIGSKWKIYYISGVALADYGKGSLSLSLSLASQTQVIDLGPIFILNFGPDYDTTKLPHNQIVASDAPAKRTAMTPAAQPVATENVDAAYVKALDALRATLPKRGVLINTPGVMYSYGPSIAVEWVSMPDVAGGKVKRSVMAKADPNPWSDAIIAPVDRGVKKGDTVFVAVQVRALNVAPGAEAGAIPSMSVAAKPPNTPVVTTSASMPKGAWAWIKASGIADRDYADGELGFSIQLGNVQQTLDIGPLFVLNLGQGVSQQAVQDAITH